LIQIRAEALPEMVTARPTLPALGVTKAMPTRPGKSAALTRSILRMLPTASYVIKSGIPLLIHDRDQAVQSVIQVLDRRLR